ncbi:P-loop containing nucleoside triphosphate hydrolase protein [Amylocarpus encephaloides]|uniref:P-loop containing nucleoside triphosphate hydrolase protein n=1 Tax=Amylocarpus encephaloides TaxID=45428 RepID=A0A9P8C9K7_9HELO|nr:P-loop containing nucleoside triphosphate hydrolase protein [Amylocarpus encephaloides]
MEEQLRAQLASAALVFQINDDLLAGYHNAIVWLGDLHTWCKESLTCLKVIEFEGPILHNKYYTTAAKTSIDLHLYELFEQDGLPKETKRLPQTEEYLMPNVEFDGIWESLVFDTDCKSDLIWKVANMERAMQRSNNPNRKKDRIILLYGPSGTGKSSLCQAVAQKISIRFTARYSVTKLIEIATATLLSKYFSESAKIVEEIFKYLARTCRDNPDEFYAVVINEVESVTMSRHKGLMQGESQDTLRATNALLTGLDRLKCSPNIIVLCTSNMMECMDAAFLSRCCTTFAINPPARASKYAILRDQLQKLIDEDNITHTQEIPLFEGAIEQQIAGDDKSGRRLLDIVDLIQAITQNSVGGRENSARFLSRLPEEAIELFLRQEECTLEMTYTFMERLLRAGQDNALDTDDSWGYEKVDERNVVTKDDELLSTEVRLKGGNKRKRFRVTINGDVFEAHEELSKYLANISKRSRK